MANRAWNILLALLLLSLMTFSAVAPALAAPRLAGPTDPTELGAFMDGLMATEMNTNHIPGAVVVVVKDGQVFFAKGYGYADLEARIPVDPGRTLFRPGSVAKPFVWTAVMQLVEQDKLSLDEDINAYLDFEIPATYPEPITLKHFLSHTPGFEHKLWEGLFKLNAEDVPSLETYLKKQLPARVFPPGKFSAYSNYGAALAGYIVERVSGMPFAEYVEKNIFAPLGMTRSTFRQPLPDELAPDLSGGYNYDNGGYVRGGFEYIVPYPPGSLSASGLDMAKFMIAHLQTGAYGEARILREETARQMHSQHFTHDPRLTGFAHGFLENVINDQYEIVHGGDTLLFHAGLYLLLEHNIGLYIATNATGGAGVPDRVNQAFLDRYYPLDAQPALTPTADFASRTEKYAGEYYSSTNNFTTFEKIAILLNPPNSASVSVDEQNNVVMNKSDQYVEVEPGLLINREHPDDRLVMKEENGQVVLYTRGSSVWIKTPWYGSRGLHLLIFAGNALLFLGVLIGWTISFFSGLIRRGPGPLSISPIRNRVTGFTSAMRADLPGLLPRLARMTSGLFSLVFLTFIVGFVAVLLDENPAYGIPNFIFESPPFPDILMNLPVVLGVLGIAMLVFTLVVWWQRYWTPGGRLFYTFLTISASALLWALIYWNFLL
jgi:CubicO group peptidase (beta-lactamase class C family)